MKSANVVKSAGRDLIILSVICAMAWGLTRIRLHSRQIERMRAQVVYSTNISQEAAESLMDCLQQVGFLNGVPRTYHVDRLDNVIHLLVVAEPAILENPQVEVLLRDGFSEVCRTAFPGNQVTVSLNDTKLAPFKVLIKSQQF